MTRTPPLIVAFCGHSGVGKTTAARAGQAVFGGQCFSFAALLKEIAADLWQLSHDQLYGSLKDVPDSRGRAPRHLLQQLGAAVRKIQADTWIHHVLDRKIQGYFSDLDKTGRARRPAWIDDLRHLDEAAAVRLHGGVIVKIEHVGRAPGKLWPWLYRLFGIQAFWLPESVRQIDLIEADVVVRNNGNPRDFEHEVIRALHRLGVSYTPVTITPPDEEQWETVLTERIR